MNLGVEDLVWLTGMHSPSEVTLWIHPWFLRDLIRHRGLVMVP